MDCPAQWTLLVGGSRELAAAAGLVGRCVQWLWGLHQQRPIKLVLPYAALCRVDVSYQESKPGADDVQALLAAWWPKPFTTDR